MKSSGRVRCRLSVGFPTTDNLISNRYFRNWHRFFQIGSKSIGRRHFSNRCASLAATGFLKIKHCL